VSTIEIDVAGVVQWGVMLTLKQRILIIFRYLSSFLFQKKNK